MEFKFQAAPHYRQKLSTQRIMWDLTLGLLVVYAFGLYNAYTLGSAYLTNAIVLMVTSVLVALITEAVWAICTKKKVVEYLLSSFGWITAIILVLMVPVNTEPYAIAVATFLCIFFGKLVFGGFGQNIFNPAAVGRAIIFASFAGSISADLVTAATPTTTMSSAGWLLSTEAFNTFLSDFGGIGGLFLGTYSGALGETSDLIILLVGIYLVLREVIDWRIPVTYVGVIFVSTLCIGFSNGLGLDYALFSIFTGGVMFGAVFMLTDPVTSPNTRAGKIVYAALAAFFTVLIRYCANYPEGVLFSILLVNILTPVIDKAFDGKQVLREKKNVTIVATSIIVACVAIYALGFTLTKSDTYRSINVPDGQTVALADDYSDYAAELVSQDGDTYVISVRGFGLINPGDIASHTGHSYSRNEITVTVDPETKTVTDIEFTTFGDTPGYGDVCLEDTFMNQFIGLGEDGEVNCVTGATYTSESVVAAVKLALNGGTSYVKGGEVALNSDFSDYSAEVTDNGDGTYHVTVRGFGLINPGDIASHTGHSYSRNEFDITVNEDGSVASVVFSTFGDTPGYGDKCQDQGYLDSYVGKTLDDNVDLVSTATWTANSVAAAVNAALSAAAQ